MIKPILTFVFMLMFTFASAQKDFEKSLDSIQTLDDVTIFLKKNKEAKGKVIVFNREKHNTRMADRIFSMRVGAKRSFDDAPQKTYYKVIEKYTIPYYRVSVVYLDGNKMDKAEINSLRSKVVRMYNEGFKFQDLARQYSMDNSANQGGDLGWFTEGELHPEFERQVIEGNYRSDDIFMIDIPETNSYYVALMTYDKRMIDEAKVLKVTEPRK